MNEYDKGYAAGLRHAFLIAKSIAKTQAFYLDTVTGTRQAWVRSQIAERIQDAADLFAVSAPVEPKPEAASDENPAVIAARELARRDAAGPADGGEAEGFIGPCVHGRDPYDRCDGCFDLTPKQAQAVAYAEDFRDAPIPTDEALASMTKEIAEWKLVVKKARGRVGDERDAKALHEQLRRSATVCPKDGCMLWRGHTEAHATAEQVSTALASPPQAATGGSEAVRNAVEAWQALAESDIYMVLRHVGRGGRGAHEPFITALAVLRAFTPTEPRT